MTKLREPDELDMFDEVDRDFAVIYGILDLVCDSGMEDNVIAVFDDLQDRIKRIEGQYKKVYDELYPMPTNEEIPKRIRRGDKAIIEVLQERGRASEDTGKSETPEATE